MPEIHPETLQRLMDASGPSGKLLLPLLNSPEPTLEYDNDKGKGVEPNPVPDGVYLSDPRCAKSNGVSRRGARTVVSNYTICRRRGHR